MMNLNESHILIVFISVIFLIGCEERNSPIDDFIQKYNYVDFSPFKGYGIYQRGIDKKGNKLIYISKTLNKDTFINSGNVVVAIDSNRNVVYTDTTRLEFSLNLDSIIIAVHYFDSLQVNTLSVDYEDKAYFSFYASESPQLMKSVHQGKYKGWKQFQDNWYKKTN